jgi:hypothetical protein
VDAAWAGLLAAVVGVGGTLGSAWLTQRRSDALRREDWERQERSRLADLADQRLRERVAQRREAYTAFNAASRHYLACLNELAYTLRRGTASLDAVEAARTEFRQRYAEAQMIVPDEVLTQVRQAHLCLGQVYGTLARLSRGALEDGDDIAAVPDSLNECWRLLTRVRATMRADLQVTDPSHE